MSFHKKHNRMPRSYQMVVFALLIFMGFLITNQIERLIATSDAKIILKDKILALNIKKDELLEEQVQLRYRSALLNESLIALQNQRETNQVSVELSDSYTNMLRFAGLSDESGPGVTIVLHDQSPLSEDEPTPDTVLIHSQDIHYLIQTLVNIGASAIEVNGERITNLSCVTCVGPTIRINDRRFPAPFVIKAICDPDSTYDILINDAIVISHFEDLGLIQIEKSTYMTIGAYTNLEYVRRISEELGEGQKYD